MFVGAGVCCRSQTFQIRLTFTDANVSVVLEVYVNDSYTCKKRRSLASDEDNDNGLWEDLYGDF